MIQNGELKALTVHAMQGFCASAARKIRNCDQDEMRREQ